MQSVAPEVDHRLRVVAQDGTSDNCPENDAVIAAVEGTGDDDVEVAQGFGEDGAALGGLGVEGVDSGEGVVGVEGGAGEVAHQAVLAVGELIDDEAAGFVDEGGDFAVACDGQGDGWGVESGLLKPACE